MSRHDVVQLPLPLDRRRQSAVEQRQDNLTSPVRRRDNRRLGEVAGGATADCAAILCCCPCMTVNLLVLAVYKVPTAICRKAWRRQRRTMLKNKAVRSQPQQRINHQHTGGRPPSLVDEAADMDKLESSMRSQTAGEEDIEFERRMWGHFKGTGFFRSYSQREI